MEYEINLENLIKMKRVFEEADEDGSGELDPGEFYEKLGPYLGRGLNHTEAAQLFMRVDADCGGTIDWEEFINFFFLQRAAGGAGDGGTDWRLHPQDFWRREWRGCSHKEAVERVYCCPAPLEQYITGGRCGQLRVWSAANLAPVQTLANGGGWVTDCAYVECPSWKKLVVTAQDRTISFYDPVRSTFEYSARLSCPGTMGPPLCLAELEREAGLGAQAPRLVWGDTDPPPPRTERQLVARRDYDVLHSDHSDWVTRLQHIPDVGLVSSSLDSTLCMLDLERGKLAATVSLHRKGVRTFGYSPAFSLVASAGVERSVLLWQPKGNVNRKVGELAGHSAGISQLVVADEQSQVLTLTDDHVVRVWDLRNHKCVQAITKSDWLRPEDCKPSAMGYDTARRRLVCASHKPVVWAHRPVELERMHDSRLVAALYNATFSVVVSGDEGGTIVMWNVADGRRDGGFSLHSSPASACASPAGRGWAGSLGAAAPQQKLTAMAFDANQRRLLTASDGGAVRMWNFSSGAPLREFKHREGPREITALAFVQRRAQQAEPAAVEEAEAEHEAPAGAADGDAQPASPDAVQSHPAAWVHAAAGNGDAELGCSDLSEHAMLSMQQQRRQHQQSACAAGGAEALPAAGAGAAAGDDGSGNLVLAAGWCRSLCVWEEGEEQACSQYQRLGGHAADVLCMAVLGQDVAATGDYEGEVRLWHLPTNTCLAAFSCGGAQFERAVRRLCWLEAGGGELGAAPLLAACSGDGSLQFWRVELPPLGGAGRSGRCDLVAGEHTGSVAAAGSCSSTAASAAAAAAVGSPQAACSLAARIAAAHRPQDCVTALCLGAAGQPHLFTGDSSGHIALWDVSGILACSPAASGAATGAAGPAGCRRLAHWHAAGAPIVSLALLGEASEPLLLVGSQDAMISIWTGQGGLVGVFGSHSWDLRDRATWQDPEARAVPPPLPGDAGGCGLTPREVIANTPRRCSWGLPRSASGITAPASARGLGGSGPPSARGREHAAPVAISEVGMLVQGQADSPARIAKLCLPLPEEGGAGRSPCRGDAVPAPAQHGSLAPSKAGTPAEPQAPQLAEAVHQFLSADSAGARLSALAAEAAAAKAGGWGIPVHVQAHSALALQRMDAVPANTADMWAQVKAYNGAQERERQARAASPTAGGGRRRSSRQAAPATIAAIMGRATTAFGRRATQPHQHADSGH